MILSCITKNCSKIYFRIDCIHSVGLRHLVLQLGGYITGAVVALSWTITDEEIKNFLRKRKGNDMFPSYIYIIEPRSGKRTPALMSSVIGEEIIKSPNI